MLIRIAVSSTPENKLSRLDKSNGGTGIEATFPPIFDPRFYKNW